MKHILLFLIEIYQKLLSPIFRQLTGTHNRCRFSITCSEYAKQSIAHNGALKGTTMAISRLLHCQPFAKAI